MRWCRGVRAGRCEGAPPLWPWMQVLRWLGAEMVTPPRGRCMVEGLPEFQLFERVGQALRDSAAASPQIVVVDDLHRADEASLRLLAYLGETLWPVRLGMIVTFRNTEVAPASLAARCIANLGSRTGRPLVRAWRAERTERGAVASGRRPR